MWDTLCIHTMSCKRLCSVSVLVRTCGYWSLQANDASQFGGTLPVYMSTHSVLTMTYVHMCFCIVCQLLHRWESAGCMKVVVKAPDEQTL